MKKLSVNELGFVLLSEIDNKVFGFNSKESFVKDGWYEIELGSRGVVESVEYKGCGDELEVKDFNDYDDVDEEFGLSCVFDKRFSVSLGEECGLEYVYIKR